MDELSEIVSHLNDCGLPVTSVTPDGKLHKLKLDAKDSKMSGWYKCYQNHSVKSGEVFYVVIFGNFREGTFLKYHSQNVTMTKEDRSTMKEQIKKARKEEEEEKRKTQLIVADDIKNLFTTLRTEGYSAYLTKKKVDKCKNMNVYYDTHGTLYVPMRDIEGKYWSLQRITEKGTKRYKQGGKIIDCFNVIGDIDKTDNLYITEGFATGASIHMAINDTVIVTFTASNLVNIARVLRKEYPDKNIIICGDEDKFKEQNTGRKYALEAEKASLGKAIFPVFKDEKEKPTDFNDLHCLESLAELKEQLSIVIPPKLALYALGFREGEYFFTSSENRQIVGVTTFSEQSFLGLMPLEYWEALYPGHTDQMRVDWTFAKSELMKKCRSRGLFDGFNIRGAGVWIDEKRIIVNMGDHLLVDGKPVQLGNVRSRYFYTLGKTLKNINTNPMQAEECETLIKACQGFKWARPDSGILLAGILILSRVCGALPNRPHAWITGGAETGKTTLLENLIKPIIGDSSIYVQGGTTEAGVRQSLASNSIPVLFDEFETNGRKSDENIASLIELMRGAWSDSSALIIKGGASGNASTYKARFSAIVSSIRTKLTDGADKGRFTILELAPHGNNAEHWKHLSNLLAQIDDEYSDRLFARTIRLLPVIFANLKLLKKAMAQTAGARFSDQYGVILAAYATLLQDAPISESEAVWLVKQVNLDEEKEVSKEADHDTALDHLMSTKITYEGRVGREEDLVGELILACLESKYKGANECKKKALSLLGIRVEYEYVAIASPNHAEMQSKIWKNTKWSESWGILKRVHSATFKNVRLTKNCAAKKCIVILRKRFTAQQELV